MHYQQCQESYHIRLLDLHVQVGKSKAGDCVSKVLAATLLLQPQLCRDSPVSWRMVLGSKEVVVERKLKDRPGLIADIPEDYMH